MRELYYILDLDIVPLLDMRLPINARHVDIPISNINPELIRLLSSVDIEVSHQSFFYSYPGFKRDSCHVDGGITDIDGDWPSRAKLNFVLGDTNTITTWYDVPADIKKCTLLNTTSIGHRYQYYKLKDCIEIASATLAGWHLFEAGVPHAVLNPTLKPRWAISLVMKDIFSNEWLSYIECKTRILKLDHLSH